MASYGNYYPQYNTNIPQWSVGNQYVPAQQMTDSIFTVPITNPQQVEIYPVAAGNTVMFIDYQHCKMYSKTNPGNGLAPIIKFYSFQEETQANEPKAISVAEYATKEDITKINDTIANMSKMLEELTK